MVTVQTFLVAVLFSIIGIANEPIVLSPLLFKGGPFGDFGWFWPFGYSGVGILSHPTKIEKKAIIITEIALKLIKTE